MPASIQGLKHGFSWWKSAQGGFLGKSQNVKSMAGERLDPHLNEGTGVHLCWAVVKGMASGADCLGQIPAASLSSSVTTGHLCIWVFVPSPVKWSKNSICFGAHEVVKKE